MSVAQGAILRNSLLEAGVAEHVQLLLVFSARAFSLQGCAVETKVSRYSLRFRVFRNLLENSCSIPSRKELR
jgi:hypothetical protein